MSALTNTAAEQLFTSLLTDNSTWNNYFLQGWRYSGNVEELCPTEECRRGEACLVACGYDDAAWSSCNASVSTQVTEACNWTASDTSDTTNGDDKSGGMPLFGGTALALAAAYFLALIAG